ncbi:MAG: glycosyltransferase family 9 protein [Ignavibacteriae bacterium]|nr:glycosyltransferase family 9 protein [Ignavibacteriota bacterium]
MIISRVENILIMKFCCFGDLVFISPVIASFKFNYPQSKITLICSPWVRDIAPYFKDVDEVIEYSLNEKGKFFSKVKSFLKLILLLKSKNFDTVFLGHRNDVFGYIGKFSGIKNIFGFKETRYVNLGTEFDKNAYEPMRYLSVLEKQGLHTIKKLSLEKRVDKKTIKSKYELSNKITIGLFPFGGINPGTDMEIKRWSLDKYIVLSEELKKSYPDFDIILIEGKESTEKINKDTICKKYTVDADLISVCDIFVSGDTGPLHIASAFNVNTVSIFGPSDPELIAPRNEYTNGAVHETIWKNIICSPCYTPETAIDRKSDKWVNSKFICHTKTLECIKSITVEEVKQKIETIIKLKRLI